MAIWKFSINGGKKKLTVKGGSPCWAPGGGRHIRSVRCGGRGSCGACKCKVLTDVGPHLPTELP
jgi:Na+-transporting NADH:ubiquinone oxidoreductase subunit F